jgi:hypothetical protein
MMFCGLIKDEIEKKSKSHNNNNLVITVHADTESDYTHKLEIERKENDTINEKTN